MNGCTTGRADPLLGVEFGFQSEQPLHWVSICWFAPLCITRLSLKAFDITPKPDMPHRGTDLVNGVTDLPLICFYIRLLSASAG